MEQQQFEILGRLAVALGIGLLIGLERGWKRRLDEAGTRVAGFRTNALAGLLGGIFGVVGDEAGSATFALGFVGFAAVMGLFYWREARTSTDVSATSAVASLCAFALGGLAGTGELQAASAFAVIATLLLAFKDALQGFLRRFTFEELRAVLILLAMTAVALPLLPDQAMGPWNALNPRQVWIVTILIAAMSFAGYVAGRLIGPRWGPLVSAALGGLVSSTAVTIAYSRIARTEPGARRVLVAGILVAASVMFLRVGVIAAIVRPAVAASVLAYCLPAVLVFIAAAALIFPKGKPAASGAEPPLRNPFELRTVLLFGALLAAASILAAALQSSFGAGGLNVFAAVSGLADVDAATLGILRLGSTVGAREAGIAILIAAASDSFFKAGASWWIGGREVGIPVTVATLLALGGAAIATGWIGPL